MERVGDILKRGGHKNIPTLTPVEYPNDDKPDRNDPERIKWVLNLAFLENTFSNFEVRRGSQMAVEAFQAMAEGINDKPLLFCYGTFGDGKTHLVEAMILRLWERGITCPYFTFEDIAQSIKRGMRSDSLRSADDIIQGFCKRKYLVIDDFGAGTDTKWAVGRLEVIIDYRYRYRLWTVLTTNLDWRELEELSGRIVSRFYDSKVSNMVLNEATDYRKQKKL